MFHVWLTMNSRRRSHTCTHINLDESTLNQNEQLRVPEMFCILNENHLSCHERWRILSHCEHIKFNPIRCSKFDVVSRCLMGFTCFVSVVHRVKIENFRLMENFIHNKVLSSKVCFSFYDWFRIFFIFFDGETSFFSLFLCCCRSSLRDYFLFCLLYGSLLTFWYVH